MVNKFIDDIFIESINNNFIRKLFDELIIETINKNFIQKLFDDIKNEIRIKNAKETEKGYNKSNISAKKKNKVNFNTDFI